jgi:DNA invertase Pin-like site-specific DNA recombinase
MAPLRAAQYVRMSTEHQQYSIANQCEAIGAYASDHNMLVVRTYSDAAKSGVTLERRDALQALLADVENGSADYSAVLVYDVSRWGRFQDVDESAYYEYRCKRARISVHYCAEPFVNDGSLSSALLKAIKRAMAGEYSRELSAKVSAGKSRLVKAGFRGGGAPGYGLRRLLVDQQGSPKGVLKRGELKSIATDRTVQIPGPPEEIEVVREIYRLFVHERLVPRIIAERLNQRGIMSEYARPWTRALIQNIVTNPKYIGANVLNRRSYKLGSSPRGRKNPRDGWLVFDNVFEPIVDLETFRQAQDVAATRNRRYSDQDLLDSLKRLLHRVGALSVTLIDRDPQMPRSRLYHQRFGSMYEAYRRIGYEHGRRIPVIDLTRKVRAYRRDMLNTIVDELIATGTPVRRNLRSGLVTINDEVTLRFAIAPCIEKSVGPRWMFRLDSTLKTDLTIVARLTPTNEAIQDYCLLPRTHSWSTRVTVGPEKYLFTGISCFDDLSFLKSLAQRTENTPEAGG